jgi:hypothetical protein
MGIVAYGLDCINLKVVAAILWALLTGAGRGHRDLQLDTRGSHTLFPLPWPPP